MRQVALYPPQRCSVNNAYFIVFSDNSTIYYNSESIVHSTYKYTHLSMSVCLFVCVPVSLSLSVCLSQLYPPFSSFHNVARACACRTTGSSRVKTKYLGVETLFLRSQVFRHL